MFSALVVALSAGLLAPQEPAPSPQPAHPWSELVLKGGAVWTGAEPWPDGVAISFYESLGYSVCRHVLGYYSGDEDAYDMRKPLSRDADRRSAVPLPNPIHPEELEDD